MPDVAREKAVKTYKKTVTKGVIKVMSKMGISTVQGYQGAQIFEAVGLSSTLVDAYFTGTPSRVGGIGMASSPPRSRNATPPPSMSAPPNTTPCPSAAIGNGGPTGSTISTIPNPCTCCSAPAARATTASSSAMPR